MKKKPYVTPDIKVLELMMESVVATSIPQMGSSPANYDNGFGDETDF